MGFKLKIALVVIGILAVWNLMPSQRDVLMSQLGPSCSVVGDGAAARVIYTDPSLYEGVCVGDGGEVVARLEYQFDQRGRVIKSRTEFLR